MVKYWKKFRLGWHRHGRKKVWYPKPRFYIRWHELVKLKGINWEKPVEFHEEADGFNRIIITLRNTEIRRR